MELQDWPWLSVIGILVPLASLAWRINADRSSRFPSEVDQFDEAIDRAAKRRDPLQFVYRAALFQRLYRVHQRDKTSRALGSAFFWGAYAALFFAFGVSSAVVDDQDVAGAAFLAALISFAMAGRAVVRYQDGMLEREPQAAAAYFRAMYQARQRFIKAVPKASPRTPPMVAVWRRFRSSWEKRLPILRQAIHLLLIGALVTAGISWWLQQFPEKARISSWCATAACLGVTWLLLTRLHAKSRVFFSWLLAPGLAPALDWSLRICVLVVLCWPFSAWLAAMSTNTDVPTWGWALDLAALEVLGGMAIAATWPSKKRTRSEPVGHELAGG